MGWSFYTETNPTARKDYPCEAAEFISAYSDELSDDDAAIFKAAEAEGCKIKRGSRYIHIRGMIDGEWVTFRARPDMSFICLMNDLYPDNTG